MVEYILFREAKYRTVRLRIYPFADFSDILKTLNQMEFPELPISSEQIIYAILELLNNSLRAHKEKNVQDQILTQFTMKDKKLHITIQDWGGGFDISSLPYNLDSEMDSIDTNNDDFQDYRERHGYIRFGIGLYVVKKTFTSFDLSFTDREGNRTDYDTGLARGTRIELTLSEDAKE